MQRPLVRHHDDMEMFSALLFPCVMQRNKIQWNSKENDIIFIQEN